MSLDCDENDQKGALFPVVLDCGENDQKGVRLCMATETLSRYRKETVLSLRAGTRLASSMRKHQHGLLRSVSPTS